MSAQLARPDYTDCRVAGWPGTRTGRTRISWHTTASTGHTMPSSAYSSHSSPVSTKYLFTFWGHEDVNCTSTGVYNYDNPCSALIETCWNDNHFLKTSIFCNDMVNDLVWQLIGQYYHGNGRKHFGVWTDCNFVDNKHNKLNIGTNQNNRIEAVVKFTWCSVPVVLVAGLAWHFLPYCIYWPSLNNGKLHYCKVKLWLLSPNPFIFS